MWGSSLKTASPISVKLKSYLFFSRSKLEEHVASKKQPDYAVAPMSKTRNLVAAILERVELLLHVTIETERPPSPGSLARSVSQIPSMAASGRDISQFKDGATLAKL